MRGQSSPPDALVNRSKLRLEGKKKKKEIFPSIYLQQERWVQICSLQKHTVFRQSIFLSLGFPEICSVKAWAEDEKREKSQTSLRPALVRPSSKTEPLISQAGGGRGRCPQKCCGSPGSGLHGVGVGGSGADCHLRSFTLPVELIKALNSVLIQAN